MRTLVTLASGLALLAASAALAQKKPAPDAGLVDRIVKGGFANAAPDWQARLDQDETQKVCSETRNAPSAAVAERLMGLAKASIRYPDDGKLMGDWQKGEALAQNGYGLRFTDYPPRGVNGGNCYACHQLDKKELSFGTLGPSLAEYGKIRKFAAEDVKAVYERIYNPHAAIACANMPRLGANGVLTIDQIKDLTAYVMSPESPVNK